MYDTCKKEEEEKEKEIMYSAKQNWNKSTQIMSIISKQNKTNCLRTQESRKKNETKF